MNFAKISPISPEFFCRWKKNSRCFLDTMSILVRLLLARKKKQKKLKEKTRLKVDHSYISLSYQILIFFPPYLLQELLCHALPKKMLQWTSFFNNFLTILFSSQKFRRCYKTQNHYCEALFFRKKFPKIWFPLWPHFRYFSRLCYPFSCLKFHKTIGKFQGWGEILDIGCPSHHF